MSTWHNTRWESTRKQFFQTHRTLFIEGSVLTRMRIFDSSPNTISTLFTVKIIRLWAYSTNATSVTMEYLFLFTLVIKQIAYFADILCKLDLALVTVVVLNRLNSRAVQAFDQLYGFPVHLMVLFEVLKISIPGLVVTNSASVKLLTFHTLNLTSSHIMGTPELSFWNFEFKFFFTVYFWLSIFHLFLHLLFYLVDEIV